MRNYGLKDAKKIPPMPPCPPPARSVKGDTPKPIPYAGHEPQTVTIKQVMSDPIGAIAVFMSGFLCGFIAILPIWYALTHA